MATICPFCDEKRRCDECKFSRPDPDRYNENSCWVDVDLKSGKLPAEEVEDIRMRYLRMYLKMKEEK
jgi:hypothetical protein